MRYANLGISLLVAVLTTLPVNADTLALRDGKTITGTFPGATDRQVEFPDLKISSETRQQFQLVADRRIR